MANHHAGNLGDLWKHLPLAALLELERPAAWWESHAGSATYPPLDSPGRAFGVDWYRRRAPGQPQLAAARYTALLQGFEGAPGSAAVAMEVLGGAAQYLLCDLDADSLGSLRAYAAARGLPPGAVQTAQGDGLATLAAAPGPAGPAVALLDPFHPEARLDGGPDALELFDQLADRGLIVALWYCFFGRLLPDKPGRAARHRSLARLAARPALWWGELALARLDETAESPGLQGVGLLVANASAASVAAMGALGSALCEIYADARLADGGEGALRFQSGSGRPA